MPTGWTCVLSSHHEYVPPFRLSCVLARGSGYITGFACQELVPHVWLKWRIMLGIGIIPPAIIVMCLTFLPESPRWLISRGRIREGYKVRASESLSFSLSLSLSLPLSLFLALSLSF